MQALIVNHLWQSTLFGLTVAFMTLLFRNNGAHVRYWLWWAASVKFLVPFSLFGMVGASVAASAPEALRSMTVFPAMQRVSAPLADTAGQFDWLWLAAAVWALGALFLALRWGRHGLQLRAIRCAARPAPRRVGESVPGLPVLYTASTLEPGLVGIVRPALLLPDGIDDRLTPEQMRAVFGHELAHWRRRDNLTGAVHMLVAALFWFHPLVWWIGRRLIHERELACDEAVMAAGHAPDAYAEGILNVCHFYVASRLACAPGVSGADLKARIAAIMLERKMVKLHIGKKLALVVSAAAMIALPVVAGAAGSGGDVTAEPTEHLMPLKRVPAVYPKEALDRKLEGRVVLECTIDKKGRTRNIKVVESRVKPGPGAAQPDEDGSVGPDIFNRASIEALKQFLYAPAVEDGRAIERKGVQFTFIFELAKNEQSLDVKEQLQQAHQAVAQAAKQLAAAQEQLHRVQNIDMAAQMAQAREQIARAEQQLAAQQERFTRLEQSRKEQTPEQPTAE